MSEVSGRSTILTKVRGICPEIDKESPEAGEIVDLLKDMEHRGYQYEGAEASFELLVRRHLGKYKPFFELERSTILEQSDGREREPQLVGHGRRQRRRRAHGSPRRRATAPSTPWTGPARGARGVLSGAGPRPPDGLQGPGPQSRGRRPRPGSASGSSPRTARIPGRRSASRPTSWKPAAGPWSMPSNTSCSRPSKESSSRSCEAEEELPCP